MHFQNHFVSERKDNFRLLFYAALVGVLSGLVAVLYRYAIAWSDSLRGLVIGGLTGPLPIVLFFAGLVLLALLVGKITEGEPLIKGSGIPQVEGQIHGHFHPCWWKVLVKKFIGGALCIVAGLSLGREGPSIQLGAMAGQGACELTKRNQDESRYLIVCGACAGLAAAFNAPLAGVMFALEEVHRRFSGRAVFPAMVAAISADLVSKAFFGVDATLHMEFAGSVPYRYYIVFALIGVVMGAFSTLYNKVLLWGQKLYGKLKCSLTVRMVIPFVCAGILALVMPEALGGGHNIIESVVDGHYGLKALLLVLAVKFVFSMISFCSGAPGGIFFPMLVLGSLVGGLMGMGAIELLGLPEEYMLYCILMGMAGMFAGVVRAPLTGILLVVEMSGSLNQLAGVTVVACVACLVGILLKNAPIYESLLENMLPKKAE